MAYPRKDDLLSGRYRIEELLGEGAMGRVYRAVDLEQDEAVAVKVMKGGLGEEPTQLKRFEREVATLRRLAHPDILRYIDHGRDGETDYLVIELLEGAPLAQHRGDFLGDADRVMLLGARLARAFDSAHRAGVIHRDIKPGNIHIANNGEPRILDYGLARWVAPEDGSAAGMMPTIEGLTQSNAILGTLPYMSPEQLRAEPVDRRSDIFSLAVVLYELASGQRPYQGNSVSDLYLAMEGARPPRLETLMPRLSSPAGKALDAILRHALDGVAGRRFQSMGEFADALKKALELSSTLPKDASIAILLPPQLVAARRHAFTVRERDTELQRFAELLGNLDEHGGGLCVIRGPAGIGKSALADEMVRMAHGRGCLCLTSTVHPHGTENAEHPAAAWLRRGAEVFPDNVEVQEAASLFDARQLPNANPGPGERAPRREQRIFSAVASLAARMPLVLFLEDVHLATAPRLLLLRRLAASAAGVGFVLVLTQRGDAAADREAETALDRLFALPDWCELNLAPLGVAAIRGMIEEAYPGLEIGDALLGRVTDRAGGNPSFVLSVLKLLEGQGALTRVGVDWMIEKDATIPDVPEARLLVEARLDSLDSRDLELLAGAAVLGPAFERRRLAELVEMEVETVESRLRWLDRKRQLVLPADGGYRFDQRVTREVLLERLPEDRRTTLHLRAATTLAAQLDDDASAVGIGAVAEHLIGAGQTAEALPYIRRTVLQLRHNSAPEDAIPWLRRGLAIIEQMLESSSADGTQYRVEQAEFQLELGETMLAVARHKEALEHLERARGLAADAGRQDIEARSLILLSRDYLARGDMLHSERRARDAVRLSRRAKLDTEHALALSAEAHALSRSGGLEEAEDLWKEAAGILEDQGRSAEAAEVYFRLGNQYFRKDRAREAETYYEKALAKVDEEHSPRQYARILNALGGVKITQGAMSDALERLEHALAIRRRIGAHRGAAASLHNISYTHYLLGEFDAAEREDAEVIRMRRDMGDSAGLASAQCNHAEVLHALGRIEEALGEASEALATKRELEDLGYIPACLQIVGECELTLGRFTKAHDAFREIQRDFSHIGGRAQLARFGEMRAEWLAGNTDVAAERLEEVVAGFRELGVAISDTYGVHYWCLRILRENGAEASRMREVAVLLTKSGPQEPPPQTRLSRAMGQAEIALCERKTEAARKLLLEALNVATDARLVEWKWRVHQQLAALEPAGSKARSRELTAAVQEIRLHAASFRDRELRQSYLDHRERAGILELVAAEPNCDQTRTAGAADAETQLPENDE